MYIPIWTELRRLKQLEEIVDRHDYVNRELRKLRESHGKTLWKNKKGLKELFVWKKALEERIKRLEINEIEGMLQVLAQLQNDNTAVLRRVEKIQNAMLLHNGIVATIDPASETSPDGLRYTIEAAGQPDNET